MRKASQEPSYDNYIEQKLQGAFGYSDDQLLAEFEQAEAQPEDPDLLPPKDEWRKLLERVDDAEKKKLEEHKVLRLKRIAKPLILVAVLGAILVGTGIGASGKRGFEYWTRELSGSGNRVIWNNNEDNLVRMEAEEEAYQKIEAELGIDAIMFEYLPNDTEFVELEMEKGHARMCFLYNGEYIQMVQSLYNVENSASTTSDRNFSFIVKNEWISQDILVEKNLLSNGKIEYAAMIKKDKAHYYISAIIAEKEFVKMIEKIKFY